jgi:hypothetical protein
LRAYLGSSNLGSRIIAIGVGALDGNGKLDLVVACRTGLYVFFDKGYTPRLRLRETNILSSR